MADAVRSVRQNPIRIRTVHILQIHQLIRMMQNALEFDFVEFLRSFDHETFISDQTNQIQTGWLLNTPYNILQFGIIDGESVSEHV